VQAGKGTEYGIRMTKQLGFDTIDIFADPLDLDPIERKLIRTECQKQQLPIVSLACVAVGVDRLQPLGAAVPLGTLQELSRSRF
jgi:sugar phosphate isomerase/epimerase